MSNESKKHPDYLRAPLTPTQREHLRSRAIDPEWAEEWDWHWSGNDKYDTRGRIGIPVLDAKGREINVRRYRKGGSPKVLNTPGRGKGVRLLGMHELGDGRQWVVVTGGEMDMAAARSAGLIAVCATAGENALPQKTDLELMRDHRVAILLDCDATGRTGSVKWAKALEGIAAEVRVVDLSGPGKYDVNDWFVEGRTAAELLALIEESPVGLPDAAPRRRATDAFLKDALDRARRRDELGETGSREGVGFWLAGQLRDERYTQAEAWPVMQGYQQTVTSDKDEPYTEQQARVSLDSAWTETPREPRGQSTINIVRPDADFDIDTIRPKDAGMADLLWEESGRGDLLTERSASGGILWAEFVGDRWLQGKEAFVDRLTNAIDEYVRPAVRELYGELDALDPEEKEMADGLKAHIRQLNWYIDRAHTDVGTTAAMRYFAKLRRARLGAKLDTHPNLINFANGTMDVENRNLEALRPHDRSDFITKVIPHNFDPHADQRAWRRHMEEVLPDEETRAFLKRWWGVGLSGLSVKLVVLLFSEHPHSGKTTTTEVVKRTSGDYAALLPKEALMSRGDRANQAMATMLGVRFATTAEFDKENLLVESQLKLIASDEFVQIRKLYGEFQEFRPEFKTTITTNNIPDLSADGAVWDRIAPISFPGSFAPDDGLQQRLVSEHAEAVLAWRVEGLRDYLENGLQIPQSIIALRDRQRADHDVVWRWADEHMVMDAADFEPKNVVRDRFNDWYDRSRLDLRKRPGLTGPTSLGARFKAWLELHDPGAKHEGGRNGDRWEGVRFR